MDQADYEPGIDMTGSDTDPLEGTSASKGHRKARPAYKSNSTSLYVLVCTVLVCMYPIAS